MCINFQKNYPYILKIEYIFILEQLFFMASYLSTPLIIFQIYNCALLKFMFTKLKFLEKTEYIY